MRSSKLKKWLGILSELSKLRISQLVALSTATGYVLFTGELAVGLIPVVLGVFLLSGGAAALNEYQEREMDARMPRTRYRPIPSGRISAAGALLVAVGFMAAGTLILWLASNVLAVMLGLLNIIWYNGIYTPLKKRTPFAVVPGALIGAIPPAIGWVAAGGYLLDSRILALGAFFFIWQIPHFWLLLLKFGRDYEQAGFPSLTRIFSLPQLARITFMWTLATAAASVFIPLYGIGSSTLFHLLLFFVAAGLVLLTGRWLANYRNPRIFNLAFYSINSFLLLVMTLLVFDRLVLSHL